MFFKKKKVKGEKDKKKDKEEKNVKSEDKAVENEQGKNDEEKKYYKKGGIRTIFKRRKKKKLPKRLQNEFIMKKKKEEKENKFKEIENILDTLMDHIESKLKFKLYKRSVKPSSSTEEKNLIREDYKGLIKKVFSKERENKFSKGFEAIKVTLNTEIEKVKNQLEVLQLHKENCERARISKERIYTSIFTNVVSEENDKLKNKIQTKTNKFYNLLLSLLSDYLFPENWKILNEKQLEAKIKIDKIVREEDDKYPLILEFVKETEEAEIKINSLIKPLIHSKQVVVDPNEAVEFFKTHMRLIEEFVDAPFEEFKEKLSKLSEARNKKLEEKELELEEKNKKIDINFNRELLIEKLDVEVGRSTRVEDIESSIRHSNLSASEGYNYDDQADKKHEQKQKELYIEGIKQLSNEELKGRLKEIGELKENYVEQMLAFLTDIEMEKDKCNNEFEQEESKSKNEFEQEKDQSLSDFENEKKQLGFCLTDLNYFEKKKDEIFEKSIVFVKAGDTNETKKKYYEDQLKLLTEKRDNKLEQLKQIRDRKLKQLKQEKEEKLKFLKEKEDKISENSDAHTEKVEKVMDEFSKSVTTFGSNIKDFEKYINTQTDQHYRKIDKIKNECSLEKLQYHKNKADDLAEKLHDVKMEFNEKIAELEEENKNLGAQKHLAEMQARHLETKYKSAEIAVIEKENQFKNLETDVLDLKKNASYYGEQLTILQKENSDLKKETVDLKEEKKELGRLLKIAESSLTVEIEGRDTDSKNHEKEVKSLKDSIEKLNAKIKDKDKLIEDKEILIKSIRQSEITWIEKKDKEEKEVAKKQKKIAKVENLIKKITTDNQRLENKNKALEADIAKHLDRISALTSVQTQLEKLQQLHQATLKEKHARENELFRAKDDLRKIELAKTKEIEDSSVNLKTIQQQEKIIESYTSNNKNLIEKINDLEKEISQCKDTISVQEKELKKVKEQSDKYQAESIRRFNKKEEMHSFVEKTKKESDNLKKDMEKQLNGLRESQIKQLDAKNRQITRLNQNIERLDKTVKEKEDKIKLLENTNVTLDTEVTNLKKVNHKFKIENTKLKLQGPGVAQKVDTKLYAVEKDKNKEKKDNDQLSKENRKLRRVNSQIMRKNKGEVSKNKKLVNISQEISNYSGDLAKQCEVLLSKTKDQEEAILKLEKAKNDCKQESELRQQRYIEIYKKYVNLKNKFKQTGLKTKEKLSQSFTEETYNNVNVKNIDLTQTRSSLQENVESLHAFNDKRQSSPDFGFETKTNVTEDNFLFMSKVKQLKRQNTLLQEELEKYKKIMKEKDPNLREYKIEASVEYSKVDESEINNRDERIKNLRIFDQ